MCSLEYHHNPNHSIFLYWFFTTLQIKWISSSLFIILFGYGVIQNPWVVRELKTGIQVMTFSWFSCSVSVSFGATQAPYASYQYLWNPSFSCRGENSWNSLLGGECEWITAGWVLLAVGQRFPQLCLLDRTWFRVLQVLKMENCGSSCFDVRDLWKRSKEVQASYYLPERKDCSREIQLPLK